MVDVAHLLLLRFHMGCPSLVIFKEFDIRFIRYIRERGDLFNFLISYEEGR